MLALRGPAPARARHDRRGDRRAGRPLPGRARAAVHARHARLPRARRPDRPRRRRSPAALLNVKPILTIRDGEVVPLKRVRGSAEGVRGVRRAARGGLDGRAVAPDRDRPRRGARAARRGRGARRAGAAERAGRGRDVARRRRRHARRARHGRALLVRRPGLRPEGTCRSPRIVHWCQGPGGSDRRRRRDDRSVGAARARGGARRDRRLRRRSDARAVRARGRGRARHRQDGAVERRGRGGARRGLRVLESRPAGAETQLSFAVLRDLLGAGFAEAVASLPERQRNALEVALLFEEAGEAGPDAHTIAAATLGALRRSPWTSPSLVAIDDAQWIDGASAAALAFAVRRLGESRVSFLVGRRSGEARPETLPFDEAVAGRRRGVDRARSARRTRRSASSSATGSGVAFPQAHVRAHPRHVGRQPVLCPRDRTGARAAVRTHSSRAALPVPDTLQPRPIAA